MIIRTALTLAAGATLGWMANKRYEEGRGAIRRWRDRYMAELRPPLAPPIMGAGEPAPEPAPEPSIPGFSPAQASPPADGLNMALLELAVLGGG
jgi:hypothetical protein